MIGVNGTEEITLVASDASHRRTGVARCVTRTAGCGLMRTGQGELSLIMIPVSRCPCGRRVTDCAVMIEIGQQMVRFCGRVIGCNMARIAIRRGSGVSGRVARIAVNDFVGTGERERC